MQYHDTTVRMALTGLITVYKLKALKSQEWRLVFKAGLPRKEKPAIFWRQGLPFPGTV